MNEPPSEFRAESDRIREFYGRRRRRSWEGAGYLVEEKQALLLRAALEFGGLTPAECTILDVGCGTGGDLVFWNEHGVAEDRLFGTDLFPDRVAAATKRLAHATVLEVGDFSLPFADAAFEVTTASLVMSSIVGDSARRSLFAEMRRTTKPGGLIAIYDFRFRRPFNRDVVAMTASRVKRLWRPPDAAWPAAPFLPLLPAVLRLPGIIRSAVMWSLPRTHCLYLWHR